METWLGIVVDYGFPMAVTFYLLHRMEKKLDQINRSVLLLHHSRQWTDVNRHPYPQQTSPSPLHPEKSAAEN
ncbi:YvrJ family protein [Alteribacter populi]|uniref:YvrJ family protein n=1 Tax=Alteribacter populi TaxID=2011011 RepID=UPI000BBB3EFD